MSVKRKDTGLGDALPKKKSRTDTRSNSNDASDCEAGSVSDASEDYIINFTDNGKKRADSEARRAWNYVCDFQGCGQRFNRPCRLEAHQRSHNKERPFECTHDGCGKTFPRKDHLQRHLKQSHTETAETVHKFACEWEGCGKTFSSNSRLLRHKEVHESKFYCTGFPPCHEPFRKQKTLDAHIKTVHLEEKPYPCTHVDPKNGENCSHGYQTENALRRHVARAHNEEEELFFCMACATPSTDFETTQNANGEVVTIPKEPLTFPTAAELQAHKVEVHPPTCTICGQIFKEQKHVRPHMKAQHTDPATQVLFPCTHPGCDRTFNRKSNLKVHIQQVHLNLHKYACVPEAMYLSKHSDLIAWDGENACDQRFKTKSSLEQHIRTHHLGLQNRKATRKLAKPRKKLIPDPSALTLLTGVGYEEGRPVPCLMADCPVRFAMDRDLKRHLKAVHDYTDADVQAALLERDAITGGQFWIGGLDQQDLSMVGSTEPSVPQTPMYFGDQAGLGKANEVQYGIDPDFDVELFGEEMDLDVPGFTSSRDLQESFQRDMLAPVQQYNTHTAQG